MSQIEGEQVIGTLPNGFTLRSGGKECELGAYVRFCDKRGGEVVYWDKQEWADEPEEVMGAILAILKDPSKLSTFLKKRKEEESPSSSS